MNKQESSEIRVATSLKIRMDAAVESTSQIPPHTTNGDEERYADKCGTFTKGLKQDGVARVNLAAYQTFKTALESGKIADFDKIIVGGTATLNGPMGALAYDLEGADSAQFGDAPPAEDSAGAVLVPAPPALQSSLYGVELIELYWASLLRDVAFTDYATNPTAIKAAAELTKQKEYQGPRDDKGQVTPDLLFRGGLGKVFPGETDGPYISQFFITPTMLGRQCIDQKLVTYTAKNFLTDEVTWFKVQNGVATGIRAADGPAVFGYNARVLGAYTNKDVLYQAYFTAFLVMQTLGVPANPGTPYAGSKTQNGFAIWGPPDIAATLAEVASRALKAVWYQKWSIHLRHRPEAGGGIVHLIKSGRGKEIDGMLDTNILDSDALQASFTENKSYLLSQAFPEGSPTHPAYPTGHGTVAGACITVLKFFFDGTTQISDPMVPFNDGAKLVPYTGPRKLTVNGELHKLGHNISFGHGILAGIHWRSDTDSSMLLGEAVALRVLRDRALTYKEPFTVKLTKFDGSTATVSNQ
jgi:hypothetical protein